MVRSQRAREDPHLPGGRRVPFPAERGPLSSLGTASTMGLGTTTWRAQVGIRFRRLRISFSPVGPFCARMVCSIPGTGAVALFTLDANGRHHLGGALMRALIARAVIALIAGSVAFSGPAHAQKSQLGTSPAGGHNVEPHAPEAGPPERRTRARTRGESRNLQTGGMDSVGRRERWKPVPADHKRTPDQGSPGWTREQTEAAEKDRVLDRKIRSICRGC